MKGRVRLQALDDIAESQYELQLQAYNEGLANPNPGTPASRLKPDLLEVQRIYQVDWAQRLELPWQPTSMKSRASALTCDEQIEAAYEIVINKESRRGYLPKTWRRRSDTTPAVKARRTGYIPSYSTFAFTLQYLHPARRLCVWRATCTTFRGRYDMLSRDGLAKRKQARKARIAHDFTGCK